MRSRIPGYAAAALGSFILLSAALAPSKPEDDLVGVVRTWLAPKIGNGWEGLDKLPGIRWAAAAPTSLKNCLPDGGCYTRQGAATLGDRNLTAIATGARTIVSYLYLRNTTAPIGEVAVIQALTDAGFAPVLARCPVRTGPGAGGTNWYRLKGEGSVPGVLSIQTSCNGRPCEGFVLSQSEELPPLQASQVSIYSTQCAAGVARTPVSTAKPHELVAQAVVDLLVPASAAALPDWKALTSGSTGITWFGDGPTPADLRAAYNDPNPVMQSGTTSFAERKFSVMATGTPAQPRAVHFEEQGMHPRGEHMLGVVYQKGVVVQLVRCGPVYTESTNTWYRLTSARTKPAVIRQSIRYDGNMTQETYELRLDGSLPTRDPRDREPGVSGCQ